MKPQMLIVLDLDKLLEMMKEFSDEYKITHDPIIKAKANLLNSLVSESKPILEDIGKAYDAGYDKAERVYDSETTYFGSLPSKEEWIEDNYGKLK